MLSVTTFRDEEAEAIELMAGPESRYVGKPLRDANFPHDAVVGALVRPSGEVIVPRGHTVVQAGDRLIVFALERVVPALEAAFLAPARPRTRRPAHHPTPFRRTAPTRDDNSRLFGCP